MTWDEAIKNGTGKGYRQTANGKYETFICENCKSISLGTYDKECEAKDAVNNYRINRFKQSVKSNGDNPDDGQIVEDHYIAYPSGNIYNLYGHLMEGAIRQDGYKQVVLNKKTKDQHRIIAEAFVPNENELEQVNHINGIKTDNRTENLEWVTRSENLKHAFKLGLEKPMRGEDNPCSKLTEENVRYIRDNYKKNDRKFGFAALGRKFGVHRTTVSDAAQKVDWRHLDD